MLITANQPFGEWGKIFSYQAMTLAAIDRIVHHATILEMNVDSYRRKEAVDKALPDARHTRTSRFIMIVARKSNIPHIALAYLPAHTLAAPPAILIVAAFHVSASMSAR